MFCPEGFLTLLDVYARIGEYAKIVTQKMPEPKSYDLAKDTDVRSEDAKAHILETAYREWLFAWFMEKERDNFFACSPSGIVLKLSRHACASYGMYNGGFPEYWELFEYMLKHLANRFCFIESYRFVIWAQKDRTKQEEYGLEHQAELLLPLDGWPVCWRIPAGGFGDKEIQAYVHTEENGSAPGQLRHEKAMTGRPPLKREAALNAYLEVYPDGHGETPIKVVYERLRQHTALEFSQDTAERAIAEAAELRGKIPAEVRQKPLRVLHFLRALPFVVQAHCLHTD